jgi:hypothetical protein
LVSPACRNTSTAGPPGLDRLGKRGQLGDLRVGAPGVERPEPPADLGGVGATGGEGTQRTQFFLGDPGGEIYPVESWSTHPFHIRANALSESRSRAQQQQPPPVRPGRVAGPAAPVQQLAGDPLPNGGDRAVSEQDQVEVVDREDRVCEQFAHRAGVAGVRVDHHHLHAGAEFGAALLEPAAHRRGGTPVDLPEQPCSPKSTNPVFHGSLRAQPPPGPRTAARATETGLIQTKHRSGRRLAAPFARLQVPEAWDFSVPVTAHLIVQMHQG